MDLKNAKPGEVYDVYATENFVQVSAVPTSMAMAATVVAVSHNPSISSRIVILGWKGSGAPHYAYKNNLANRMAGYDVIPNFKDYPLILGTFDNIPVLGKIRDCDGSMCDSVPIATSCETYGHTCDTCGNYNEYAAHDPSKGKWVCTGCKIRW